MENENFNLKIKIDNNFEIDNSSEINQICFDAVNSHPYEKFKALETLDTFQVDNINIITNWKELN